jgi:8-oxo-dGTP diphosphatase
MEILPMGDRACVVLLHHDHILLVRQTYQGSTFWTFPGGGIEPGETPMEAAIREVKEETGLDIYIHALLVQRPRSGGTGIYYCYLGCLVGGRLALGTDPELPSAAQELHELRWFAIATLQSHPEVQVIWEALKPYRGVARAADKARL